jgi:hypothetical protein
MFVIFAVFAINAEAAQTTLAAAAAVKELTGVMGVLSDTEKIGVATITISIIPYAFSRLRSMLH